MNSEINKHSDLANGATDALFSLRIEPDGVYLGDGRAIPSANNSAAGVNYCKPVIDVHGSNDRGVGLLGSERGKSDCLSSALRACGNQAVDLDCLSSALRACGNQAVKIDCPCGAATYRRINHKNTPSLVDSY